MINKIENALLWKEIRQTAVMVITISVLMVLITIYMHYQITTRNLTSVELSQLAKTLFIIGVILSFGLAFLQAAGVRIIEASQNLESFLFTRPVERFTLVKVYYITSLFGWLIFAVIACLCLYSFGSIHQIGFVLNTEIAGYNDYIFFQAITFIAHGVTFIIALLIPSLAVCATTYVASALVSAILIFKPDMFWELLNNFEPYVINLLLIGIIIAGAFYLYKNKQVA